MKLFNWKLLPLIVAIAVAITVLGSFGAGNNPVVLAAQEDVIVTCPMPNEDNMLTYSGCQKMQEYVGCHVKAEKLDVAKCEEFKTLLGEGDKGAQYQCSIPCTVEEAIKIEEDSSVSPSGCGNAQSIAGAVLCSLALFY